MFGDNRSEFWAKYQVAGEVFCDTRSYAALRAADLDRIVVPGYSLGRVHSEEKPWKTNLEPWKTKQTDLEPWKTHLEP